MIPPQANMKIDQLEVRLLISSTVCEANVNNGSPRFSIPTHGIELRSKWE
jgi:hypothetical protein